MGAIFGMVIFMGGLFALYGAIYGAWAAFTLVKYVLYRTLKVGSMPLSAYFKHYYKSFRV